MKRLLQVVLLTALVTGAPARAADEGSYQVDFQVLRIPAAHRELAHVHLCDASEWKRHIKAGEAQLLESGSTTGRINHESLTHVGTKFPIAYFDPRANSYQVQYVDFASKIDASVRELPDGAFKVDSRIDRFALDEPARTLPASSGCTVQTVLLLRPNQAGTLASACGRIDPQYLKQNYPSVTFSEQDSLLLTVSVRKL